MIFRKLAFYLVKKFKLTPEDLCHDMKSYLYSVIFKYAKKVDYNIEEEFDEDNLLSESFYTRFYIAIEKLIEDLREIQRKVRLTVNERKLDKKIDSFGLDE